MNIKHLLMLSAILATGCNGPEPPAENVQQIVSVISAVTFKSHLDGGDASDPIVAKGQRIRVVPDPSEPTQNHESIVVQLPEQTPFDGSNEQYFLRGYAIGQLSSHNLQFL